MQLYRLKALLFNIQCNALKILEKADIILVDGLILREMCHYSALYLYFWTYDYEYSAQYIYLG